MVVKRKSAKTNPFRSKGKRDNYSRLLKAGYKPAAAKRLVNTNPRWG